MVLFDLMHSVTLIMVRIFNRTNTLYMVREGQTTFGMIGVMAYNKLAAYMQLHMSTTRSLSVGSCMMFS